MAEAVCVVAAAYCAVAFYVFVVLAHAAYVDGPDFFDDELLSLGLIYGRGEAALMVSVLIVILMCVGACAWPLLLARGLLTVR